MLGAERKVQIEERIVTTIELMVRHQVAPRRDVGTRRGEPVDVKAFRPFRLNLNR